MRHLQIFRCVSAQTNLTKTLPFLIFSVTPFKAITALSSTLDFSSLELSIPNSEPKTDILDSETSSKLAELKQSVNFMSSIEKIPLSVSDQDANHLDSMFKLNTPLSSGFLSNTSSVFSLNKNLFDTNTHYMESHQDPNNFTYIEADTQDLPNEEKLAVAFKQRALLNSPGNNLDFAVRSILGGEKTKRIKMYNHHWNVESAQISVIGNRVTMEGVIQHTGRLSFNHEISYIAVFVNGKASYDINIGDRTNYVGLVLKPMVFVAKFFLKNKIFNDTTGVHLEREEMLLGRIEQMHQPNYDQSKALQGFLKDEKNYIHRKRDSLGKKQFYDLASESLDEVVDEAFKIYNERFKLRQDWEMQAYKMVKRITSTAWERVALMGVAFEDLPELLSNPKTKMQIKFNRPFHKKSALESDSLLELQRNLLRNSTK